MTNTQPQQEETWQCFNCASENNLLFTHCYDCGYSENYITPRVEALLLKSRKDTITKVRAELKQGLPNQKDAYRDGSDLSHQIYGYNSALSEVSHLVDSILKTELEQIK